MGSTEQEEFRLSERGSHGPAVVWAIWASKTFVIRGFPAVCRRVGFPQGFPHSVYVHVP